MHHMNVVKNTELRELLYGPSATPRVRVEIQRVEFNRCGERHNSQITGRLATSDDAAPIQALVHLDQLLPMQPTAPMHLVFYQFGNARVLPDVLGPAVNEAIVAQVRDAQLSEPDAEHAAVEVMRTVWLLPRGGAYVCDHDTWEKLEE